MSFEKFREGTLEETMKKIKELSLSIPLSRNTDVLKEELQIGGKTVKNRLAIQPMEGCDGTQDGKPDILTKRRYDRFARGGAGLIWFEATAVAQDGRANSRQLLINKSNLDSFREIVNDIKATALLENGFEPLLILQATHSGRYSRPFGEPEPLIARHNPFFEKDKPLSDTCIVSDDRLKRLEEEYSEAAALAQSSGFDGIDVKACHGYLNNELFSSFDRAGEYGGSFENRTRFFINALKAAQANTARDFIVTSRMNIYDGFPYPFGFGMAQEGLGMNPTEPLKLIDIIHNKLGINFLNITMGNPYENPHVNRPFDTGFYAPPESPLAGLERMYSGTKTVAETFKNLRIMSSALSYLREFSVNLAAGAINEGICDLAGFGRLAFAYPDFANDILKNGKLKKNKCCITCGKCSELMRAKSTAGCVVRDNEYQNIYRNL